MKLVTGTSGTVWKVEVSRPETVVVPLRRTVTPWPSSRTSSPGSVLWPRATRYAVPVIGAASTGVTAVAVPTREASGQAAGSAS